MITRENKEFIISLEALSLLQTRRRSGAKQHSLVKDQLRGTAPLIPTTTQTWGTLSFSTKIKVECEALSFSEIHWSSCPNDHVTDWFQLTCLRLVSCSMMYIPHVPQLTTDQRNPKEKYNKETYCKQCQWSFFRFVSSSKYVNFENLEGSYPETSKFSRGTSWFVQRHFFQWSQDSHSKLKHY